MESADYLSKVRRCPCLACDRDPAGEAAHVRMSAPGKHAGTGLKPGDEWALPLCRACHIQGPGAQHKVGEEKFWRELGLEPLGICARLFAANDVPTMRMIILEQKGKRK